MSLADSILRAQGGAVTGTIADVSRLLASIDTRLAHLEKLAQPLPGIASPEPVFRSLPFVPDGNGSVIGLICSGDTAGIYTISVGAVSILQFRLQADATFIIDFDWIKHLKVTRGLPIALVGPSGSASEGTVIYQASSD